MIRHAGLAPTVGPLAISMVEPPFLALLMATIGGASLKTSRC